MEGFLFNKKNLFSAADWSDEQKEDAKAKLSKLINDEKFVIRGKKTWVVKYKTLVQNTCQAGYGVVNVLLKEEFDVVNGCIFCSSRNSSIKKHFYSAISKVVKCGLPSFIKFE